MDELIQLIAKTYGLIGLFMIAPFIAVVYLWKDNNALRKELIEIQQKRVEDNQHVAESVLSVVKEQSSINNDTNRLLDRISQTLDRLERS